MGPLLPEFARQHPGITMDIDLSSRVADLGADRLDLAPQSAGLLAASLGLSRRFADDHEMLENAMPLYDGLYAWCRGEAEGTGERHSWSESWSDIWWRQAPFASSALPRRWR